MALTREDLTEALAPVHASIIGMSNRLDNLSVQVKILAKKAENSVKGRSDVLAIVPRNDGRDPEAAYPISLEQLLVAGNELLPSGSQNTWNKKCSLDLIKEYEPGYETDDADEATSSHRRRIHLAKLLGITTSQLNSAQMIL